MQSKQPGCAQVVWSPYSETVREMAQGFGKRLLKAQEKREATILRKSVLQHFQDLKDPRVERGQHHSLVSLVSIAILAILAGSDSFVAIERYGIAKQGWLETFLELPIAPLHESIALLHENMQSLHSRVSPLQQKDGGLTGAMQRLIGQLSGNPSKGLQNAGPGHRE